jgi:hypothetical protein
MTAPIRNIKTTIMRNRYFLLLSVIAVLLLGACKGEQKKETKMARPGLQTEMEISSNDSTEVSSLVTEFLGLVKQGDVEAAVSRLYILKDNDVMPLPQEERDASTMMLGLHQVYDFSIDSLIFYKETDSKVCYTLMLQDPTTTTAPAHMQGVIRPVRINGKWYITLANSSTEQKKSALDN